MKIHSPSAPILGFNSWDCWGFDFNQERAVANINEFVRRLKPAGYEYFCMDAGWYYHDYYAERLKNPNFDRNKSMDDFGRLIPSEIKFPDGLQFLADLCHGNNIKFGLHVMRGIPRLAVERNCIIKGTRYHARDIANFDDDCAWDCQNIGVDMTKPGAQEYYDSVIEYFADNGVDFLKVDDMAEHPEEMEDTLRQIKELAPDSLTVHALAMKHGSRLTRERAASTEKQNYKQMARELEEMIDMGVDFITTDLPEETQKILHSRAQ